MSTGAIIIEGTLNPDGSLQLDQIPTLSPGRVTVILQPARVGTSPQRGLAEVIDEISQDQQARGFQGRDAGEIEAGLQEGEDEYERENAIALVADRGRATGWGQLMLYYLDTNIVIYAVEGQPALRQRARNHIGILESAGHHFVVSQLTWTECLVLPFRTANALLSLDYHKFLMGPHLSTVGLTVSIHLRAALIRGIHKHGLADSLHLATAVENRFDRFLTNDQNLTGFPDIPVELLP